MFLPPASRTTMSGRATPPSAVARRLTCSSKSQRALIPASSTTRRSCISPHRPRASGRRSAVTRAWVCVAELVRALPGDRRPARSARRATAVLAASVSRSWASTRARVSCSGSTRCSTAALRCVQLARRVDVGRAQPALGDLQEPLRGSGPAPAPTAPGTARPAARRSARPAPARRARPAPPAPARRGPARRRRGPGRSGRGGRPAALASRYPIAAPSDDAEAEPGKQRDRVHIWPCSQPGPTVSGPTRWQACHRAACRTAGPAGRPAGA